jgi:hypothetical protein
MSRDHPFLSGDEKVRPYSDISFERDGQKTARFDRVKRLEAEASGATDPAERDRIQCEAEELRCGIYHDSAKPRLTDDQRQKVQEAAMNPTHKYRANTGGRPLITGRRS